MFFKYDFISVVQREKRVKFFLGEFPQWPSLSLSCAIVHTKQKSVITHKCILKPHWCLPILNIDNEDTFSKTPWFLKSNSNRSHASGLVSKPITPTVLVSAAVLACLVLLVQKPALHSSPYFSFRSSTPSSKAVFSTHCLDYHGPFFYQYQSRSILL